MRSFKWIWSQRSIIYAITRRQKNWIGQVFRGNHFLKEEKIVWVGRKEGETETKNVGFSL